MERVSDVYAYNCFHILQEQNAKLDDMLKEFKENIDPHYQFMDCLLNVTLLDNSNRFIAKMMEDLTLFDPAPIGSPVRIRLPNDYT